MIQFLTHLILAPLDQVWLREVGVELNLVHRRLDLSSIPYLLDLRNREVGDANGLELALLYEGLHGLPRLDKWHVNNLHPERLLVEGEALGIIDAAEGHRPVDLEQVSLG